MGQNKTSLKDFLWACTRFVIGSGLVVVFAYCVTKAIKFGMGA